MKYQIDKNSDIVGIGLFSEEDGVEYIYRDATFDIQQLVDEFGNCLYMWDGEKAVSKTIMPTAEQLQAKRRAAIVAGMRERYTADDEIALTKDAVNALKDGLGVSQEYIDMETYREQVKAEV